MIKPFIKWPGGKRQLMDEIKKYLPSDFNDRTYIEPFIGGGAVLFDLQPKTAYINDFNESLINVYSIVREMPDELIKELQVFENTEEAFYKVRDEFNTDLPFNGNRLKWAAAFIYLNKTDFNGLYRVNRNGKFNVPYGKRKNPCICDPDTIKDDSKYLTDVYMFTGSYSEMIDRVPEKCFWYLDPPYAPLDDAKITSFTSYSTFPGWDGEEQIRMKDFCDKLTARGDKFMLSNASTKLIHELYKDYNVYKVLAKRYIGGKNNRNDVYEVIVTNYNDYNSENLIKLF